MAPETTSEHNYFIFESPKKLKRQAVDLQQKLQSAKKKLKIAQQKTRRLQKRVESMEDVISELKEQNTKLLNLAS